MASINRFTADMQIPAVADIRSALAGRSISHDRRDLPAFEELGLYELGAELPAVPERIRVRTLQNAAWNSNALAVSIRTVREAAARLLAGADARDPYALGGYRILPVAKNDGDKTRVYVIDPDTGLRAAVDVPDSRAEGAHAAVHLATPGMPFYEEADLAAAVLSPDSLEDADLAVRKATGFDRPAARKELVRWTVETPRQARGFVRRVLAALAGTGSHPVKLDAANAA